MRRLGAFFLTLAFVGCTAASGTGNFSPSAPQSARSQSRVGTGTTAFTVQGHTILLNGKPFFIKGVDYAPTQICAASGSPSSYPLSDSNEPIWSQDLAAMKTLGVNVVKVYNVGTMNNQPVPMGKFLAAAYADGIYTIPSIWIPPGVIDYGAHKNGVAAIASQYYNLANTYGANKDVMGISIGGEWNQHPAIESASTWTNGVNPIIQQAWSGLIHAGVGNTKILTTTLENDLGGSYKKTTMGAGEANGFPPTPKPTGAPYNGATAEFAWGFDIYSGLANTLAYVKTKNPSRPLIVAEWGEPVGFHPNPNSSPTVVEEWPSATVSTLTNYVTEHAQTIYNDSTTAHPNSGVDSGGFYFEWSDEYWKAYNNPTAAQLCVHAGGLNGINPNPVPGFPSGFDDEAWFGLNMPSTPPPPPPSASPGPDFMSPRPNFNALKMTWSAETPAP
jgi:Glucanosyltransferase